MSKQVCIASYESMGGTFVDWSIHFLSGQTKYYNADQKCWVELSQNPIDQFNTHSHQKNHPLGYDRVRSTIEQFDSLPADALCSLYAFQMRVELAAEKVGASIDQFSDSAVFSRIKKFAEDDFDKIFDLCKQKQVQVIFIGQDARVALYHQTLRSLDKSIITGQKLNSQQELIDELQQLFFSQSIQKWKELNLTEPWDLRERIALDLRPLTAISNYKYNLQHPHLYINCLDLWTRTPDVVKKIMNYLNLDIDPGRWESWLSICEQWQKIQLSILEFVYNQPHIVEAIVNNWYYEIDLDFYQEAIIQHYLIYQHGLNLKTWQLRKFPNNTQDLHKLLEPNIHPTLKIY